MNRIRQFLREEDGPTAVEYAVMLALIVLVCAASIGSLGAETAELMDPGGILSSTMGGGS